MASFRTEFVNYERRNRKTDERNDTENARWLAAHEKAFACVLEHATTRACPESDMYRTSVFLVFSLHRRTYTVREMSEMITE